MIQNPRSATETEKREPDLPPASQRQPAPPGQPQAESRSEEKVRLAELDIEAQAREEDEDQTWRRAGGANPDDKPDA